MTKSLICLLCSLFLLMGVILGFLLAPIKGGVRIITHTNCPTIPLDDIDL